MSAPPNARPPDERSPCFAELVTSGPFASHVAERRAPAGLPFTMFRYRQPAGCFPDPPSGDVVIQMVTNGRCHAECDVGAGRYDGPLREGGLTLNVPGEPAIYRLNGPAEGLVLSAPQPDLHALLGDEDFSFDFGLLHARHSYDPLVEVLLKRLWAELADGAPNGRLFSQGAIVTLLATLRQLADARSAPGSAGGLAADRLRRVQDYVEAHLDGDIALADLAAAACLSPYHFARAFKAATGKTALAYVMERRVERAKTRLAAGAEPLAQIAYECGFANQAHFSTVFRKRTGATPGAYRRETA